MRSDLTAVVTFPELFTSAPMLFSALISTESLSGHLRLLESSNAKAAIATEYSTCNLVVDSDDHMLTWIAVMPAAYMGGKAGVSQQPTNASDVAALLDIKESLGLPDYLQWRNGSDPCNDRWAGIECRAFAGSAPRVVVLDVS